MTFLLKSSLGISIILKQQSGVMRWTGCHICRKESRRRGSCASCKRFASSPFLMRQPDFRRAHSAEIVEASLPFLAADSPVLLGGVVAALLPASPGNPAVREAMLRSKHVIARADSRSGSDLAHAIAATKDERAHAILPGPSAALLIDPGKASLPEQLFRAYGNAAIPYLERALSCTRGGSPHRASPGS
jgi:hypothetical protein